MATAPAPAPASTQKVHITVPGFQAFGEFHGYNVDCSADAEIMARHPLDGTPLDAPTLNSYWQEYLASGHGDAHGAQLRGIYWHLTQSAHKLDPNKAKIARWVDVDQVSLTQLRTWIIQATAAQQTVITYLGNAQALASNERGVYGHFVALGGIDSDLGYLVGNGDDVQALGGHGIITTRWYGWSNLVAAQINGMIALAKVAQSIPSPTPTANVPTGWTDDGTTLKASNGQVVVRGFRAYVLAQKWDAANTPFGPEYTTTTGSRQDFLYGSLVWSQANNVQVAPIGQDLRTANLALAAALDNTKTMQQRLAQIAQLAQIAAAK